jgi:triacylglycerol lipase
MKTLYNKTSTWLKEFFQIFQGAADMIRYTEPPNHYLDYVVAGRVPVIIIPGILGKWGYMKDLSDKISLRGHPVYLVPQLGINIYSIPSSAKTLRALVVHFIPKLGHLPPRVKKGSEAIRKLIEEKKLIGAVIVAHSKGGLIGKYLLTHHNTDHRVLGMVAIATPFTGSALAKFVPHAAFQELKNDSRVIQDLEHHKKINHQIISIFPEYDNYVWAESGSFLEGACRNIEVPVSGHNTLLRNKKIQKAVIESINQIQAQALEIPH